MKLFGHTFGHKTNLNSEPFEGISPTADKDAFDASEAAFQRLEQSNRLGHVTIYGAVHAESVSVIDMRTSQTEAESAETPKDQQITA